MTSGGAGGQAVPGAGDDVFFDATSGAVTITLGSNVSIRSLDCSGFTGTFTGTNTIGVGNSASGTFKLVSGMTYTHSGTITFVSTTTGSTIDSGGKTLPSLTFNGVGGGWSFSSNITLASAKLITLTNGALDMNGKTVSMDTFASSGSATRSLTLGAATLTIANAGSAATPWNINATGMTLSAASSTITLSVSADATFAGAGLTYGSVTLTDCSGTTITGANTFSNLTLTGKAEFSRVFIPSNTTISSALTANGNSTLNRLNLIGDTASFVSTAQVTISAGSLSATYLNIANINATGAASWDISAITGNSGDLGGCTGITFTTPITCYWKSAASANFTAANWSLATNGAGGAARVPLPQDTARFDANSFTAGSITVTVDATYSFISKLDFTGATNSPSFDTAYYYTNDVTLISAMTVTQALMNALTWRNISLTSAGRNIEIDLYGLGASGGLTLQDNLSTTSPILIVSGAFDGNGKTISCSTLTLTSGSFTTSAALTCSGAITVTAGTFTLGAGNTSCTVFSSSNSNTRTLSFGSGTISLTSTGTVYTTATATGLTISATTATLKFTNSSGTSRTISGGSTKTANIWVSAGTGTVTFTSVSCGDLTFTGFAGTFAGSTTLTIAGSLLMVSGLTRTFTGGLTFNPTGSSTITSATKTYASNVTFGSGGGSNTLADDFSTTGTGTISSGGSLAGSSFNFTCSAMTSNSGTRVLDMGSGTWTMTGTGLVWNVGSAGLTLTCGTSTISVTDAGASSKTFGRAGSQTYNNVTFTAGGAGAIIMVGDNTFNNLTFNSPKTVQFTASSTTTITGAFNATGTVGNLVTFTSTVNNTAWNLVKTSGSVTCDYISLRDSAASGGATFTPGANSTNVSGNSGWNFGGGGATPFNAFLFGGD